MDEKNNENKGHSCLILGGHKPNFNHEEHILKKEREAFISLLDKAEKDNALILYVIDLFSFEISFDEEINERLKTLGLIVLANKRDLLPINASNEHLKQYIQNRFLENGLQVKKENIYLESFTYQADVSLIVKNIKEVRHSRDIYMLGAKGSGKSVFLNAFLSTYKNESNKPISEATSENGALRYFEVPIDKDHYLYVLPSLSIIEPPLLKKRIRKDLSVEEKIITSKFSFDLPSSILFLPYGHFDYIKGERKSISVTSYFKNDVLVKKAWRKKDLELVKQIYKICLDNRAKTIDKENNEFDTFEYTFEENSEKVFGIADLGFFSLRGEKGETFSLSVIKGAKIYISEAKIVKEK